MMETLRQFHFIRPGLLILIPVVIAVWYFWRRSAEPLRGWRNQVDPDLLKAMTVRSTAGRDHFSIFLLVTWMVCVIAIAGPTWKLEPNPFAADAAPLMILLKADKGMDEATPAPSAMERAHLKITDLANERKGQPLGLIAYAGSAHLVLPPTKETEVVAQMAGEISSEVMPTAGDRLDLAIQSASKILTEQKEGGMLLVIADSISGDTQTILKAHQETGKYPITFLSLRDEDSIPLLAKSLHSSVTEVTPDDADITAIVKASQHATVAGITGESQRWEEAGYWLVPLIAVFVALSFRREANQGGSP